jgi:hypothetical protein
MQCPFVDQPNHRISFSKQYEPSRETIATASVIGTNNAQEPFLFQGNTFFIVGMPLFSDAFVYRITPSMTAEIMCVTGPINTAKSEKQKTRRTGA